MLEVAQVGKHLRNATPRHATQRHHATTTGMSSTTRRVHSEKRFCTFWQSSMSHLKGFSPLWASRWRSSVDFSAKRRRHISHSKGFSPVWRFMWRTSENRVANEPPQPSTSHVNTFLGFLL